MQHMARLEKLAPWLVAAAVMAPGASVAQTPEQAPAGEVPAEAPASSNVWTFSVDSSNNLVIQDLSSFASAQGPAVGQPVCLQFASPCPSDSARIRRRYSVRGTGGRGKEWRLDLGDTVFPEGGMALPFQAGVTAETGTVQAVSSPGPWTIDLQRIPAADLRAGEGKKWKVALRLEKADAGGSCWVEVGCPARAQ
jgi:hypothetical protein